jgi:hypothetical protein
MSHYLTVERSDQRDGSFIGGVEPLNEISFIGLTERLLMHMTNRGTILRCLAVNLNRLGYSNVE